MARVTLWLLVGVPLLGYANGADGFLPAECEGITMRHTLFVCSTCLKDGEEKPRGSALAEDVRGLLARQEDPALRGFEVETFECMSGCGNPNVISFRAPGKAAYLFSGIDVDADQTDILAFAQLYIATEDGWIEDARPLGRLRFCLQGRIPAQKDI